MKRSSQESAHGRFVWITVAVVGLVLAGLAFGLIRGRETLASPTISISKDPQLSILYLGGGTLTISEEVSDIPADTGLGAFSIGFFYPKNLVQVTVKEGPFLSSTGRITSCFTDQGESFIRFHCLSTGASPGPTGSGILAYIDVRPRAGVIRSPTVGNGALAILDDQAWATVLADVLGDPIEVSRVGDAAVVVKALEGDLNLDCVVNVLDEQAISFRYYAHEGSLYYDPWYDLEPMLGDMDIDIKDLQFVFGRYGWRCEGPGPTPTPTPTATTSPTPTPIGTSTASPTATATRTPTAIGTPAPTATASATSTPIVKVTPTPTTTASATSTPTATASATSTPIVKVTRTPTTTAATSTPTPIGTPAPTATASATSTPTAIGTPAPTATSAATSTPIVKGTPTPTIAAVTSTPTAITTPAPTATAAATSTPTPIGTPAPTATAAATSTPIATGTPTVAATRTPTPASAAHVPTPTGTGTPSAAPVATATPPTSVGPISFTPVPQEPLPTATPAAGVLPAVTPPARFLPATGGGLAEGWTIQIPIAAGILAGVGLTLLLLSLYRRPSG